MTQPPAFVNTAPPTGVAPDESGNLPTGILLKRRYRIMRKIAQGGMGAVYEATDTAAAPGTRWAVKEMSPAALPSSERTQAITDFRREAQMLAALQHPNLPKVVETFEELGKHFLVMEFVPGRTLQNVIEATAGFLPEERVRVWARQLFDVINYLHSQNPPIIYRDIKPANVMLLQGTERIKLIDFGIARFHKAGKARDTEAFGTAGYAPPEQYGKGQTDQRSDIYALGATLHYLITKHDPGLNPFNWLPARQYNAGVSASMNDALQRALNLDPQRRFQTVLEFAGAIGLGDQISHYPQAVPASVPVPTPAPVPANHSAAPAPAPATPAPAQKKPARQPAPSYSQAPIEIHHQPQTQGTTATAPAEAPAVVVQTQHPLPQTQTQGTGKGQRQKNSQPKPKAQTAQKQRTPNIPVAPAPSVSPVPAVAPLVTSTAAPAVGQAAASVAAPPLAQPAIPVYSAEPLQAPAVKRQDAPVKEPGAMPVVTAKPDMQDMRDIAHSPSVVIDHGTTSTASGYAPVAPAMPATNGRGAHVGPEPAPTLQVSDHLVDMGEARWNSKSVRRVNLLNVGGGEMKGTVVATQPWVALNMQAFHGNAQTVEIRVKNRELPFGRMELHVPNLFAMIWTRAKWALPFIGFWFWVVLLVASSIGKMLLVGSLAVIGALLLTEVLIWWLSLHVKLFVPAEKLNSGRLLVKSSGGEQQIEVRVKARPSGFRKAVGWLLAAVLFVAEIAAVAWIVLAWAGIVSLPVL